MGNNQTFSSPITYCQTFYPNMTLKECLVNKSDEFLNSTMFINSLASGNDSMIMPNHTIPLEMMAMLKGLRSNMSMGQNRSSLPPQEDWCARMYPSQFMNDSCDDVFEDYQQKKQLMGDFAAGQKEGNDPKDQEFKNRINIGFGDDIQLDFQMSDDFKITKMKAKFMDYFKYAMVQTTGTEASKGMNNCDDSCGREFSRNMCCTSIEMFGRNSDKEFVQYECLDNAIVDLNTGIWLDEYYYELECQVGEWDGDRKSDTYRLNSGAATLAAGVLSMAAMITLV